MSAKLQRDHEKTTNLVKTTGFFDFKIRLIRNPLRDFERNWKSQSRWSLFQPNIFCSWHFLNNTHMFTQYISPNTI